MRNALVVAMCLILTACGGGGECHRRCGKVVEKWHECTYKCYDMVYYMSVDGDYGKRFVICVSKNTYGMSAIGDNACGCQ